MSCITDNKDNGYNANKNGYYEHTFKNGYVYKGFWKDNKRHGHGELMTCKPNNPFRMVNTIKNDDDLCRGYVYVGEWENDKKHGKGKITFDNNDYYQCGSIPLT
jgi:hypothetical protein